MMDFPAWLPVTGTLTQAGSKPLSSAIKVLALTMSRVVTPKILLGWYALCFFKTSVAVGMMELTGFDTMPIMASGQCQAQAAARWPQLGHWC